MMRRNAESMPSASSIEFTAAVAFVAFIFVSLCAHDADAQVVTTAVPANTTRPPNVSTNATNRTRVNRTRTRTLLRSSAYRSLLNRTRSMTFTVVKPQPTNRSSNADDFSDDYAYYCALLLKVPLATFDPTTFADRVAPGMPDKFLVPAVIVIDYCGVGQDSAGKPLAAWDTTVCTGLGSVRANYTVVRWAILGSKDQSNYTSIKNDQIVGLYSESSTGSSGSTTTFFYKIFAYVRPTTSPAPGFVSRAADAALTPLGGLIIFIVIVIIIVIVFLVVRYVSRRNLQRSTGNALDAVGSPQVGDVYAAPPPAPGTSAQGAASSSASAEMTPVAPTPGTTKPAPNGTTQVVY